MYKSIIILLLVITLGTVYGQDSTIVVADDTSNVFTHDEFLQLVLNNHPVARQAKLLSERGRSQLRSSRGGFDPKVFANYDKKDLGGSKYYEYKNVGLKVPTWFGVELKTGWDWADKNADHYNPEKYTSSDGTGYLGVSVPVGQNMLMDERRKVLRQGELAQKMSEIDQINMINELLYQASKQYWEWVQSYENQLVYKAAKINAEERFKAIKTLHLLGESAAMDTVEAFTQIQSIVYEVLNAEIEFQNQRLFLSNYIWAEDGIPLELGTTIYPEEVIDFNISTSKGLQEIVNKSDSLVLIHPLIRLYENQVRSLEFERKFKQNKLLPKGKINYNLLSKGYGATYSQNDYKIGFSVSMPILLRQERGEYELYKIKVQEYQLKLDLKRLEVMNKIRAYNVKLQTLAEQIEIYESATANYKQLLKFEDVKVLNGESSLFKVNYRQMKYFNAKIKLNGLITKFYQTKAAFIYYAGLGQDFYQLADNE